MEGNHLKFLGVGVETTLDVEVTCDMPSWVVHIPNKRTHVSQVPSKTRLVPNIQCK
jgi:hypothetical protein